MKTNSDLTARSMGTLLKKGDGPYTRAEMHEAWKAGIISSFNGMHHAAMIDPFISEKTRKEYLRCIDTARNEIVELANKLAGSGV